MATPPRFDMTKDVGEDISVAMQVEQVGLQMAVGDLSSVGAEHQRLRDSVRLQVVHPECEGCQTERSEQKGTCERQILDRYVNGLE